MTIHVIGRTVACRLFVKLFETEAAAQAFAASTGGVMETPKLECDGLQYPCGAPATHEVSEMVGHDISGAPVIITTHYCDAHYEEQASWAEVA